MYFLNKKDGKTLTLNDQEYDYVLEKWDKKEYWNDLIKLQGSIFTAREIKSIEKELEKVDDKQEQRRLYMENLNAKRKIPEWEELETQQYQLLKDKQEAFDKNNQELADDIQQVIVDNSKMMIEIAKQHNLYKPELNVNTDWVQMSKTGSNIGAPGDFIMVPKQIN